MNTDCGILLTNMGSPDEPTSASVREYLKKFLTDPQVINIPKLLWYPILYGLILPFRAKNSAKLYQKIWTDQGSPLTIYSKKIAEKLQQQLNIPVAIGMHYGNPTIADALEKLHDHQVKKIIILPLYPQYSETSTGVSFNVAKQNLTHWRIKPELQLINDYASHPDYINTVAQSIWQHQHTHGKPQHLLFSFHGIPEHGVKNGDPYADQCHMSARLIAEKCELSRNDWSLAFQSRLSRSGWLTPFTDKKLSELPQQGITHLHVVCPGFAVDCLETLEEIAIRGKNQFISAGGKQFHYIPALNDSDEHIKMLSIIADVPC